MAWSAPKTWTNGSVVMDTDLNAHVRDNLRYLKGLDGQVTLDSPLVVPSATVSGMLTAGSATVSGVLTAGSATVSGLTINSTVATLNGTAPTLQINTTQAGDRRTQIQFTQNGTVRWWVGNDIARTGTQTFFVYDNDASAYRWMIDSLGRVGVGTVGPTQLLDVNGTARVNALGVNTTSAPIRTLDVRGTSWFSQAVGINLDAAGYLLSVGGEAIKSSGGSTWAVYSDQRAKDTKKARRWAHGLASIRHLKPMRYHYNGKFGTDSTREHVGLYADEVESVIPEAIDRVSARDGDTTVDDVRVLRTDPIFYALINAVQELAEQNDQQQQQLAALEARLVALEARVTRKDASDAHGNA